MKGSRDATIFLDRDGTLNPDPGYISSLDQFRFYTDAMDALDRLARGGFSFVIVTNQSGIGRGIIPLTAMESINDFISQSFDRRNIPLLGIYTCPHLPEEGCDCRKPGTGMFEQASADHHIVLGDSYLIGDSVRDIQAGKSLGVTTLLVRTGNGGESEASLSETGMEADFTGDSLVECAEFILAGKTHS
ncbi:MAG: HAD family hydrolase [Candidatus Neomarinimicrobiota bacterium]